MEKTQAKARIVLTRLLLVLITLGLALCGLIVYGLWRAVEPRTLGELQAWVMLSTLALVLGLPVTALVAFLFGRRDARVLTDGLEMGVNQVVETADRVTEIKGKLADRMRQPPVTVQVANLPAPPITHRQLEGGGETIDL